MWDLQLENIHSILEDLCESIYMDLSECTSMATNAEGEWVPIFKMGGCNCQLSLVRPKCWICGNNCLFPVCCSIIQQYSILRLQDFWVHQSRPTRWDIFWLSIRRFCDEPCIGDSLLSQKFLVFDSVFIEMSEAHNIFIIWNVHSMRMLSTKCEFALVKNSHLWTANWCYSTGCEQKNTGGEVLDILKDLVLQLNRKICSKVCPVVSCELWHWSELQLCIQFAARMLYS